MRRARERGRAEFGWLDSRHSFSFGHYYNPNHMGISVLRVINDDTVAPGAGFNAHGHQDMEIISYVLKGAIEHKDSLGNQFVVPAGEVQRMTAGTGITHSEYNHFSSESLRFLQIWIRPNRLGLEPSYEQKAIAQSGHLTSLITPDGQEGSLTIHQDVSIFRLKLASDEGELLEASRGIGYLHLIEGGAQVNGRELGPGDALGSFGELLEVRAREDGLIALWFDLPPEEG
ncbi:pirin family protein [Microbulbifer rhizosphaerae]|uniref:pirin family protein n=1 Tax=Microbulbifer rhizosphaerae TaxID=1562603 RepID=UPI001FEA0B8F|nr:pirin family protein [Microbulbifer rhizosphaerae]